MNFEKLEQLVNVINQMKEAKKQTGKADKTQEAFYAIALLKEIYGQNMNSGILRETFKDVRTMLFDNDGIIRAVKMDDKFGIQTDLGLIAAKVGQNNDICRVDIRAKIDVYKSYSFSNNCLETKGPLYESTSFFDEDGIEQSRDQKQYFNVKKENYSRIVAERNAEQFNLVHVKKIDMNGKTEHEYDGQIVYRPFSLEQVWGQLGLYSADVDVRATLLEEVNNSGITYRFFPELKDVVLARVENSKLK